MLDAVSACSLLSVYRDGRNGNVESRQRSSVCSSMFSVTLVIQYAPARVGERL